MELIILILAFLILVFLFYIKDFKSKEKPIYGISFSQSYTQDLGLDWQKIYLAILDELKPKNLRLPAYWDKIESQIGEYNFSDLDWQLQEAQKRGISLILVIGRKLPRWPECHDPLWVRELTKEQGQEKVLILLKKIIERYKNLPNLSAWQIENEPLINWFGICPKADKEFLKREVALVKSLDGRPIIITDSGELSSWLKLANLPDILGITMYRIVWDKYLGYWSYFFLPPAFYHYKADLIKIFYPSIKKVIVTELQMEPWPPGVRITDVSLKEQYKSFNLKRFKKNLKFSQRTGFSEFYLWGAEWWYWLKQQGDESIWQEAKKIWQ